LRKSKDIKGLFEGGSNRLTSLKERLRERSRVLEQVIAALPDEVASNVATAGIDHGVLIVGAVNAAWATRLRYLTEMLRLRVGEALGVEIERVRIKVVTQPAAQRKSPDG
jgi:predicted nucleic acid-binding Zn ribbon protein